ncbi:MAG: iron ABC transporter permease [Phycisphaeraceae bacterium]|nr:iron ABC transporter permease [Phycisphaeraceae bacterium]
MVVLPIAYLLLRAFQADAAAIAGDLLRPRTLRLLLNTIALGAGVLVLATAIALPIAWLTTNTDLPARRAFALLGVLPLAIPGYVLAYAILGIGGYGGPWHRLTGEIVQVPRGYLGAVVSLGVYNAPYMFLNLRAALRDLDPSMEETGRSLGHGRVRVFFSVMLPQLRPALLAGAMIVLLHMLGDIGVVSLMQFETFSEVLYRAYAGAGDDAARAAAPALMLILLASLVLAADLWVLRRLTLHRTNARVRPERRLRSLGRARGPAVAALTVFGLLAVVGPVASILVWSFQRPLQPVGHQVLPALLQSVEVSFPAALATTALALPIAFMARRYRSRWSIVCERVALLGYAIPSLAFALSLIVFATWVRRTLGLHLYPTLGLLIAAYALHFLAEAVGPIRSGLYLATPRLEEAARGLGAGRLATLGRVTLPLLRGGLVASMALVFLSAMKELPIMLLLKPRGFESLAFNAWDYCDNAGFAEAAPFALCILLCSGAFVGVLLAADRRTP